MVDLGVVTGAASGIGRAVAQRMVSEGVTVLAVDINKSGLESLDSTIKTLCVDVSTQEGREEILAVAPNARYLVNAAGIIRLKPIFEITIDDMREIFAVNVEPTWDLTSRYGRQMAPGSAIVNLSSSSAKLATTVEAAIYACSKTAVLSMTRSFAYALAQQGVRVNAVCPGIIDTPMQDRVLAEVARLRQTSTQELSQTRNAGVPLGRAASVVECAAVIWFLLSDQASYMTGQAVNVTGGLVTW